MKVIVTGLVPRAGLDELFEKFDVTYSMEQAFTREKTLELIPEMDGVLLMAEKADKEFLDAAKNLKVIAVNGVGYDNVDIKYAREKGIAVCNSPQSVQEPTAELTMSLMLAAARRITHYDINLRRKEWPNVSEPSEMGFSLIGATLGIVGIGRIGRAVARRAKAFGMNIIYHDQNSLPRDMESILGVKRVSFDQLLSESDIITIHTPLIESTYHLFSDKEFKSMKDTAFIINAARGPIVDESALIDALQNKRIAGAGLDVFENEPEISKELLELDNVTMTPHAGTGCLSSRTNLANESAKNIISFLIDSNPINVVN